jgi:hypothetical protein
MTSLWVVFAASAIIFSPWASAQVQHATVAEEYLLAAANEDRSQRALQPLHMDEHLVLAARLHAYQMAQHHTISHQFPGENSLAARAAETGARFSLITENVAEAPRSSELHDLWMNSAGHRANLLDPNVDAVGIAVVQAHGEFYAVEDFAHTIVRLSLVEQEQAVAAMLQQQGVEVLGASEDARETCHLETGFAGARKPWFVMRYTSSEIHRLPAQLMVKLASSRYRQAAVGACVNSQQTPFTSYSIAVLLYPG